MNSVRIEDVPEQILAGIKLEMSYAADKTPQLFMSFMPLRNRIPHRANDLIYLVNIFPGELSQQNISFTTRFEKLGAVPVKQKDLLPDELTYYTLPGGTYAVFIHRGPASAFFDTFNFIFGKWIPESEWEYDTTRHRFERIPQGYRPDDPNSEEEIWIPVKAKMPGNTHFFGQINWFEPPVQS